MDNQTLKFGEMDRQTVLELGTFLSGWLRSALLDRTPEEKPDRFTFECLYEFSKFHGVANLAFYSVVKLSDKPEAQLYAKWQKQCLTNAVKVENQLAERDRIIGVITSAGIDLLPLKGCRLIEMYPQPDYRMMADLDMLIDETQAAKVREIMVGLGYTVERFGTYHDDAYTKPPYVEVEIHRHIASFDVGKSASELEQKMFDYTEGIWDRVIKVPDHPHLYELSVTEYFIEMVLHFAKHALISGGSGIRSIMDFAVFLSKYRDQVDFEECSRVMEKIGLTDFLNLTLRLTDVWFGKGADTDSMDEELSTFAYTICISGTYGTSELEYENTIRAKIEKGGNRKTAKRCYIWTRIFPPCYKMQYSFPILCKLPILLPFCWIIRLVKAVICKRDKVGYEINRLREEKDKREK
ncbi:MAG: nucleotidyltransferase family protein [Eubacteriales bacterium]